MMPEFPILIEVLAGLALVMLVAGAMWPTTGSVAVRWPALTASALFFGFVLSSVLLSEMLNAASLVLAVSLLIFLSATSISMFSSQSATDSSPDDKEHQQ